LLEALEHERKELEQRINKKRKSKLPGRPRRDASFRMAGVVVEKIKRDGAAPDDGKMKAVMDGSKIKTIVIHKKT
jgi:hypothetical protein